MGSPEPDCDLVVIGAGIHGAGVAQAAAAAGYRILLLERHQVAHGTSSRSSKLIHGGLRYLETAQFRLVREALREREILLRVAPGLVHLSPFFLPVYEETTRSPLRVRVGLALYAVLGGLRRDARFREVPRARWFALDGLRTQGLRRVFQYWDAQTDDAALTRAVVRSAEALGAKLLQPASFLDAERESWGYRVRFSSKGSTEEVRARAIVNAAGPWANRVLERIEPPPPRLDVELVQGAHIVLEEAIEQGVYYTEAPQDRRAVFVMPWQGRTLVGTTETPFAGEPDTVAPLPEEIAYLEEVFRFYFPERRGKVREAFAGLRVLPAGRGRPFERSRELILWPDRPRAPRLVTLYGGKLTAYRASAQKVLRALRASLPPARPLADTAQLRLE